MALRSRAARLRVARLRVSRPVLAALPLLGGTLGGATIVAAPAVAAPARLIGVPAWTNVTQTYIRVRPDQSTPIVAKVGIHTQLQVWGKYDGWYRVQTQDDIFGWVSYKLLNSDNLGRVKELSPGAVETAAKRSADTTMWGTPDQLKAYYQKHGAKGAAKGLIEMGVPLTIQGSKPRVIQTKTAPIRRKDAPRKVATRPAQRPQIMTSGLASKVPVKTAPIVQQYSPGNDSGTQIIAPPPSMPVQVPVRSLAPAPPKTIARTTPVKTPAKRLTAKERKRDALRNKMGMRDKTPPVAIGRIAPVSPEDLMKARRAYLDARKEKAKDAPATNPEQNEEMGGPQITPSSFETGADNALDNRGWAPFNQSGWSGKTTSGFSTAGFSTADWSAQNAHNFRLVTEEAEAATLGDEGINDEELNRWNGLPALDSLDAKHENAVQTVVNAQKKAPSRGGSPRDRYRDAKGDFRKDIASKALTYRGRPYIFGAASPRGFDCSGLVYYILRQRGYNPPRVAAGYRNYGTAVARKDLKAGDLLLFANTYKRGISHIGIYIGNNNFVHAASTRQGVRTDSLSTKYYANKYYSARRVPKK